MQPTPISQSPNFTCQTQAVRPGTVRVIAAGELDVVSAPLLEAELSAIDEHAAVVILDLSRLAFMDSTGLQLIVRAEQRLSEAGRTLKLIRGASQIQRLFLLGGLEPHFQFIAPDET
ncbi:MAG: STAS domain-containing protein [Solirubrobacteraceae bacterium]